MSGSDEAAEQAFYDGANGSTKKGQQEGVNGNEYNSKKGPQEGTNGGAYCYKDKEGELIVYQSSSVISVTDTSAPSTRAPEEQSLTTNARALYTYVADGVKLNEQAVCPLTHLTDKQKRILQTTWLQMIGSTEKQFKVAGCNLILWMVDNVPNMRKQFTKFNPDQDKTTLASDVMFLTHVTVVMMALDDMIKLLNDPVKLEQKLRSIAKSHLAMKPPIGSKFFAPFQKNFHLFLEDNLYYSPDGEEVKAWATFLAGLVAIVKQEEAKLLKRLCCSIG